MCNLHIMQKASATLMARKFSEFLSKVEQGRSIRVLKHGRTVARLVPRLRFYGRPPGCRNLRGKPRRFRGSRCHRKGDFQVKTRKRKMPWLIDTDLFIEAERGHSALI